MSQPILTLSNQGNCPHGAPVSFSASSSKVLIKGANPLLLGDSAIVSGCPMTLPNGKPQPCVKALLLQFASKVLVEGKPVLLPSSGDMCQSPEQIPQGPVGYCQLQSVVLAR